MTPPPRALAAIREFLVLRRAEATVAAYSPEQGARVRAHASAAAARAAAGRRTIHDVPAVLLLLDAVRHFLFAALAARAPRAASETADPGARLDAAVAMPPLPPDPMRPGAAPSDDERVRAALSATDPLSVDRLAAEDAARLRLALDRAVSMLAGSVEARSRLNVRATRWGRLAAVVVLVLYGLGAGAAAIWLPKNVARDKPVHPSSTRHGDGHELVDGEIATVPGVNTAVEESPHVTIDLGEVYAVDEIRVYNRIDEAFDDCLPLAVEVSVDGSTYKPISRRDDHFSASPPWTVPAHKELARFVRLRVLKRSYLALSEVEVYGKKIPARATKK